jgi:hypothetical protein
MTTDQEQRFIDAWRRAGPELERMRNDELRALTEREGTRLATLLGVVTEMRPRPSSGLVDFQRWMMRWRQQSK